MSKKQRSVSTSTTEAEYVALCQAGKQAVWTRGLLRELGYDWLLEGEYTVPISCDNNAAIALSENPENHAWSKHIDIQYHYIRQLVAYNYVRIEFCLSTHMIANIFTKPLSKRLFGNCVRDIMHTGRRWWRFLGISVVSRWVKLYYCWVFMPESFSQGPDTSFSHGGFQCNRSTTGYTGDSTVRMIPTVRGLLVCTVVIMCHCCTGLWRSGWIGESQQYRTHSHHFSWRTTTWWIN